MVTKQKFRNWCNWFTATRLAIKFILGTDHNASVGVLLTNDGLIIAVAVVNAQLAIQFKAGASALINKRAVHDALTQHGAQITFHKIK